VSHAPLDVQALLGAQRHAGSRFTEILRTGSMSGGLYTLPAGGNDPQSPHGEDEIYYVIAGRARIRIGDEDHAVAPGSLFVVPRRVVHRFYAIDEDLKLLVVFAPAEGSSSGG
jgi:mannose-6-phosphate isomerase-like protein (cupin superfamily)